VFDVKLPKIDEDMRVRILDGGLYKGNYGGAPSILIPLFVVVRNHWVNNKIVQCGMVHTPYSRDGKQHPLWSGECQICDQLQIIWKMVEGLENEDLPNHDLMNELKFIARHARANEKTYFNAMTDWESDRPMASLLGVGKSIAEKILEGIVNTPGQLPRNKYHQMFFDFLSLLRIRGLFPPDRKGILDYEQGKDFIIRNRISPAGPRFPDYSTSGFAETRSRLVHSDREYLLNTRHNLQNIAGSRRSPERLSESATFITDQVSAAVSKHQPKGK
jgi:hypothetical protein